MFTTILTFTTTILISTNVFNTNTFTLNITSDMTDSSFNTNDTDTSINVTIKTTFDSFDTFIYECQLSKQSMNM